MRNLYFLLFYFFVSSNIQAQKVEIFADLNFGIPVMSSLKDFHNELSNQVPFENFKTTDNFNYDYGFTTGVRFNRKISVFFTNKVTGAKSSVADYSGYIRLTNELKGYTFGAKYEIILKRLTKGNLLLGFKGLVTNSKLSLKSESEILNVTKNSEIDFKSLDFGTGIGITYEYPLKFMVLRAYLDLDVYLGGDLKLEENNPNNGYLMTNNGEKVTTGWTGFNAGLGIAIPIIK
jgi:hypothetical protein